MPLNPAYYSKPELMVFECGSLTVTPFDLAYIYIRQIDGFDIENVKIHRIHEIYIQESDFESSPF